jgi:pimeloyl-ACP methyl ester carboxylesterase
MLDQLSLDASGCPGASPEVPLDLDGGIGLFGHSMGAAIAPLVLAAAPEYRKLVLSGAGGSYMYNLVYKRSPLDVRPIAEAMLGFSDRGRTLREDDAVLQLLQWVSEPADVPPYARLSDAEVLMVQGIVDTYNLPPMANAVSLAYGLDLAGPEIDSGPPELAGMRTLGELLPLGEGELVPLPVDGPGIRVVVQQAEDGIEDGHEVLFQIAEARRRYRCFLGEDTIPADGGELDPCR